MAETTTEHADIHTPEVLFQGVPDETQAGEPAKRPVGRPRKDGQPAGTVRTEPKTPPPGEEGGEDPDFFEWLKTLARADWDEQLFMYLYRTAPQIDLGKKGEWKIERYARPVTSQEIMESHGSGGYKILLDRWNPVTNHTTIVRQHYFTIVNMNYPPKVPFGQWLDKPENKSWLWAKPVLEKQLNGQPGQAITGDAAMFRAAVDAVKELRPEVSNEDQTTLTRMVIDTMKDAHKQMLEQANPSQTLELVNTIVTAVSGKGADASAGIMQLVTTQLSAMHADLAAERAFSRSLLEKLTQQPAAAAEKKSVRGELTEMLDVMKELGFSRGGSSSKTDWGEVAVDVGKELLKSLTVLGTAIITKTPAKPGQPAGARPPVTVEAHAELPAAQAQQQAPQQQQQQPAGEEEAVNTIQSLSNQFGGLFDTAAPFLVDQFVKGFTGMEFREWFRETYGTYTLTAIRAMDPRTIFGVIQLRKTQAPEHVRGLLEQLTPDDQLLEFITQFLSNDPLPDEDEDDEPEPPIIAPRPVEIRKKPKSAPASDPAPAAASFIDPNDGGGF
jgi:hypothetical protein